MERRVIGGERGFRRRKGSRSSRAGRRVEAVGAGEQVQAGRHANCTGMQRDTRQYVGCRGRESRRHTHDDNSSNSFSPSSSS
jgi:hypothetical protein